MCGGGWGLEINVRVNGAYSCRSVDGGAGRNIIERREDIQIQSICLFQ